MPSKNKIILVAEDEEPLRRVLKDILSFEGYMVLEAVNGEEGLEMILKEHPDLVLLDIVMPKMDGLTLLKKLREDEWGKTANVVILTNLSDNEEVTKTADREGIPCFVKTDIKINQVIEKIKERLS